MRHDVRLSCPEAIDKVKGGGLVMGLLLGLLASGVYLNTIGHGFVYDDRTQIVKRIAARDLLSLRVIFTTDHFGTRLGGYRPLVTLSFALDNLIAGLNPLAYHLTNILLHGAVTMLVYVVVRQLLHREAPAIGTAILFAVHPIHAEAVAWVSGRADLLAALCFLSAWGLYLRASCSGVVRVLPYGGSLLAFGLALLSKEHALLLPAVLLLSDYFRDQRQKGEQQGTVGAVPWSQRWWPYVGYLLVIGIYLGSRYLLFGRALLYDTAQTLDVHNPLRSVPWYPRVLTAAKIIMADLGLLVWPARLSADYSYNQIPVSSSLLDPAASLAAGLLLLIVLTAGVLTLRGTVEGVGLSFYLIMIAATANVFTVTHTIRAERLLYLPSLGIFLAASALALRAARWLQGRAGRSWTPVLALGMGVVCLALTVRTVVRNQDWKDDYTLWRSTVRAAPASAAAHYALGLSLATRGQSDAAVNEYMEALLIYPSYREARTALGLALARSGQHEQGLAILRAVVLEKPTAPEGYVWLGEALAAAGQLDESVAAFRQALTLRPDRDLIHYLLGSVLLRQGEIRQAIESYRNALALTPDSPIFLTSLGYAYMKQGQPEEARAALQHALYLQPGHPRALAILRALETGRPIAGPLEDPGRNRGSAPEP